MDSLAKMYWIEIHSSVQPFHPHSTHGWSLWIGACKPSSWDRETQYNHAQSTDIISHWSQHHNIPTNMICSINWEAYQSLNQLLWIPKWLAGFAPVGKV
jgi:hypothetical protein